MGEDNRRFFIRNYNHSLPMTGTLLCDLGSCSSSIIYRIAMVTNKVPPVTKTKKTMLLFFVLLIFLRAFEKGHLRILKIFVTEITGPIVNSKIQCCYRSVCFYRPQMKVMFLHLSVSHSVHRGLSAPVHAGIPAPPDQRQTPQGPEAAPPGSRPPEANTPSSRHPPGVDIPPGEDLPCHNACWEIQATSGQYSFYWNAYLFQEMIFQHPIFEHLY